MGKHENFDSFEHARRMAQALREEAQRKAERIAERERRVRDLDRVRAEEYRKRLR